MFDKLCLQKVLEEYKRKFISTQWENEKYKWEAVKNFQDNWDVNAPDFTGMLVRALAKTSNLLASMNNYPAKMIVEFAKTTPEEVRAMFIALFDESENVVNRIMAFKDTASALLEKHSKDLGQHYQTENAISTYLWLRFPDKYYIYKYGEVKTVANKLVSKYAFKKGAYTDNLKNFYTMYDEICAEIKEDKELLNLFQAQASEEYYHDPEFKTLTIDVGFYISRFYSQPVDKHLDWFPSDYSPEISVDMWVELLNDSQVFNRGSLEIMKRMKDYGGQATCSQLAIKYGETHNFYNSGSSSLARRVAEKTGCPVMNRGEENSRWWPILYVGRWANKDEKGVYTWKLRDELKAALDLVDLSHIKLFVEGPLKVYEKYTKEDFLFEVYMTEHRYDVLTAVLKNKKNIILQGAPGVGKTFAAKRIAYALMEEKDERRVEFVQFHQNYSYEDFIMGYKPVEDGFELKYGIFYRFCQKAENQPDKDHFFIIDEISRGNMSKIFGELLMLIERDYRGSKATLAYNGLAFTVPENLYIIGMMNTADRSLAMIDYALRRRFSFFEMEPGFESDGYIKYQNNLKNETFNELISKVKELNKEITFDKSLGKGFCIGHSYFCGKDACSDVWIRSVVDYDILPMLNEYWFDDTTKYQRWENILHGVFQ
ncbi:MAG: restriction endonuclease [Firmicutes bacterium HGW-Firmicutes-3]|jgi:5-methylcytosine-specific restriction protein B|nr:MAG: restriction endonuclease [Firmicutes bacterium HGW-Firmicutes-3]